MTDKIKIRPASANDAPQACPLIYQSARDAIDFIYSQGRPSIEFIEYAFRAGGGYMGYRTHKVALVHDQVAAIYALYSSKNIMALTLPLLKQIAMFYGFPGCISVLKRLMVLPRISGSRGKKTAHIANFCVNPSFRRQGIASTVLRREIAFAQAQGFSSIELDVATGNSKAINLYEKMAFSRKLHAPAAKTQPFQTHRLSIQL